MSKENTTTCSGCGQDFPDSEMAAKLEEGGELCATCAAKRTKRKIRYAVIKLALLVDSEAEACDAVNEILREQQRSFTPTSCLLDYELSVSNLQSTTEIETDDYEEGDAFNDDIEVIQPYEGSLLASGVSVWGVSVPVKIKKEDL